MSSPPNSVEVFFLELSHAKWSSDFDNMKAAKKAARFALTVDDTVGPEWLSNELEYFKQKPRPKSWRDYRNFSVNDRFFEEANDDILDIFGEKYEELTEE